LRQRPPKSVYPDKCFETIIAFKLSRNLLISPFKSRNRSRQVSGTSDASKTQSMLIGHFSDARRARAILSFDPLEILTRLIPFIGMMLVLLLVYKTRASDLDC
jgi:hypothetical protein